MGGYGSGPRGYSSKDTTSGYLRLDVRWLQREGFLVPGRNSDLVWSRNGEPIGNVGMRCRMDDVVLSYRHRRHDEPWRNEEYPVPVGWTPCNYGGTRPWFHCPVVGCGRRVAILYGSGIFACRHCHQLAYESQRETAYSRALSRAQAIREKLGGSACIADPFPSKPKGMHWRTYERLWMNAEEAESQSWPPWMLRMLARQD
jgi:hypothetical protein